MRHIVLILALLLLAPPARPASSDLRVGDNALGRVASVQSDGTLQVRRVSLPKEPAVSVSLYPGIPSQRRMLTAWLSQRLKGKEVRLKVRRLAKAHLHATIIATDLAEGAHINEYAVYIGLAKTSSREPVFVTAQRHAKQCHLGIWSNKPSAK